MNEQQLLELKKEITEASSKAAELKGQYTLLTKQLKDRWGVTTLKEGNARLDTMQTDIDKKDALIKKKTEELETQLHEQHSGS